jgi:hypothetical protein
MLTAMHFRKGLLFVGLFGLVASFSLAAYGFFLANQYDARVEFSQISRGVNPLRSMAVLYGALSVLFFLYIVSSKLKSGWQFLIAVPLVFLMTLYELRIISDSGIVSPIWPEYTLLTFFLDKSGFFFLPWSILLFILNVAGWWFTRTRKNLP